MKKTFLVLIAILLVIVAFAPAASQNQTPVADAGLSRYAALNPIGLDGTGSYDQDDSGPLSYTWRQIAGPSVVIIDANTATPTIGGSIQPSTGRGDLPTISGFTQTSEIQECKFELVVSDGELISLPDTVKVIIVPDYGADTLLQENPPFDNNKPTVIFFSGGNCITGGGGWGSAAWAEKANIISFPNYGPDPSSGDLRTYYRYGDMIIVYLSSVAPDYKQPIQTSGWSTGGQPAIDVGLHLNLTYADPRYAVNRVTFYDATPYCRSYYSESISTFLTSSVGGEQCWVDNYITTVTDQPGFHPNVLNVGSEVSDHSLAPNWYRASLTGSDMNKFNNGVIAGAYWSVIGPGKNLQLASTPDAQTYKFKWYGSASSGYMDFDDESTYPGRLPEPVTLLAYSNALDTDDEPTGALLTCKESENAVGYQLLFGPDPYRVMDYDVISDTPTPPTDIITTFPFEETWWTVKVRDQYGSTIYADPIRVNLENLPPLLIENLSTSKRYGYIQLAISDADSGDEIVVGPGVYQENVSFKGKNLTLRSADPNDQAIVAATVIDGYDNKSVVTFSGGEDSSCVLAGFTITGGSAGICCCVASPAISNCTIGESGTVSIELWHGSDPIMTNCTILGDIVVRPVAENLTTGKRYLYIQRAIDDAVNGDEIVASEGIYQENIDFKGKSLTVRSTDPSDSAIVAATVINGGNQGSAVTFSGGEDANCVLAGFTITDANNGIYCSGASPTIASSRIARNSGAGIELRLNSNPTLINCCVAANAGAGIEMWAEKSGRVLIYNYPTIANCTIAGNLQHGISGGIPTITNSIIWANSPLQITGSRGTISVTYSDIQGSFPGDGNIDTEPLFADSDNGDYHLKSQAGRWDPNSQTWVQDDVTSPCIDAANPSTPIGLEPFPNGGIINMGAYGGTTEASKSPAN